MEGEKRKRESKVFFAPQSPLLPVRPLGITYDHRFCGRVYLCSCCSYGFNTIGNHSLVVARERAKKSGANTNTHQFISLFFSCVWSFPLLFPAHGGMWRVQLAILRVNMLAISSACTRKALHSGE